MTTGVGRKAMKTNLLAMTLALLALLAATALTSAVNAQETTGTPGSPDATRTIEGNQLPPLVPKFGGVMKEELRFSGHLP
jgi:hypothetical protein